MTVITKLDTGSVFNVYFRPWDVSRHKFPLEINGSSCDPIVSTPIGYTGVGDLTIQGAPGDIGFEELSIPDGYSEGLAEGLTQGIALAYRRIASDLRSGTTLAPTFPEAVRLHRLIDRIGRLHCA